MMRPKIKRHLALPIILFILCLVIFLGLPGSVFSAPSLNWNTFLGKNGQHLGYALALDSGNNVYAVGLTNTDWNTTLFGNPLGNIGYQGGATDGVLAKLDSSGHVQWYKFFGGSINDSLVNVHVDSDDNVYVVAYAFGAFTNLGCSPVHAYVGGDIDGFIAKLDTNGNVTWCTYFGSSSNDYAWAIDVDSSGNVYVGGESYSGWHADFNHVIGTNKTANGYQGYIVKFDSSGAYVWHRFLSTYSVYGLDEIGGYLYTIKKGLFYSGGWNYPAEVGKYDTTSGNQEWTTNIGSGTHDGFGIVADPSQNIYIRGYSNTSWGSPVRAYSGGSDVYVAKLNSSGTLQWNTFLGQAGNDNCRDQPCGIILDVDHNPYVVGYSTATWGTPDRAHAGGVDSFVAKLNSSGVLQWNLFLGGTGSDWLLDLDMDSSGNIFTTGYTQQTSWGSPVDFPTGCYYCQSVVKVNNLLNNVPLMSAMNPITVIEGGTITVTGACTDNDSADTLTVTTTQNSGVSCGAINGSPDTGNGGIVSSSATCATPSVNSNSNLGFSLSCSDGKVVDVDTVTVTVNAAPTAVPQTLSVTEDTAHDILLSGVDPSDSIVSYEITSPPSHGELSGTIPDITYTPDQDFSGQDSFRFRVNDGLQNSTSATVTIRVNNENDAPVIIRHAAIDQITIAKASTSSYVNLPDLEASDPDDDSLIFRWKQISGDSKITFIDNGQIDLTTKPKKGAYFVQQEVVDSNGLITSGNPIRVDIPNHAPEKIQDFEDIADAQYVNSKYLVDKFKSDIDIDTLFNDTDGDNISLDWYLDIDNKDLAGFLSTSSSGNSKLRVRMAGEVKVIVVASDGDGGTTTEEIVLDIPVPEVNESDANVTLTKWEVAEDTNVNVTGTLQSPVWPVVLLNDKISTSVTLVPEASSVSAAYLAEDNLEVANNYDTYNFTAENVSFEGEDVSQLKIDVYTSVNGENIPLLTKIANLTSETDGTNGNDAQGEIAFNASAGCSLAQDLSHARNGFSFCLIIFFLLFTPVFLYEEYPS